MGIDPDSLKETVRRDAFNMLLFGNFNMNRLKYANLHETSLAEPTKYE